MKPHTFKATAQAAISCLPSAQTALARVFGENVLFRGRRSAPGGAAEHKTEPENILVVRLDEIGDMVMCTPFLRALRQRLPEAWITLVVKPRRAAAVCGVPGCGRGADL